jgi:predicted dehydrogenase
LMGQMRVSSEVVAQISSGFRCPFREGAHLVGSEGLVKIDEPWKPGVFGEDTRFPYATLDESEETVVIPATNPYVCEVEAMEACVLDGAKPVVPLSLSRDILRAVLALYESARSGGKLVQL